MLREPQTDKSECHVEALEAFRIIAEVLENYFR